MTKYNFKTIYFPGNKTKNGKSARVTISIPENCAAFGINAENVSNILSLSSKDFLLSIGNPSLEKLEIASEQQGQSLSHICLNLLSRKYKNNYFNHSMTSVECNTQLSLDFMPNTLTATQTGKDGGIGVTFRESKRLPIHGWYPYVEGFSANYISDVMHRFALTPSSIYDPFGGAGTTQLAAATNGIPSFYCEVNPFMTFVTETKIISAKWAAENFSEFTKVAKEFMKYIRPSLLKEKGERISLKSYDSAFPSRSFFEESHLRELLAAKKVALEVSKQNKYIRSILLLACAANVVDSSNMTRRADLRRRRPDEYKNRVVNVSAYITRSIERYINDLKDLTPFITTTELLSEDARRLPSQCVDTFDMAITSPPYLNGTNYFRNTKLELWYLDFIKSEKELSSFRSKAICAGINNVSSLRSLDASFGSVESIARILDKKAADKRIPKMIRCYFSDMQKVLSETYKALKPGGYFILDIGDSCFYNVHVPTDDLLVDVAKSIGFILEAKNNIAKRHSKSEIQLNQVELVLKKPMSTKMPQPNLRYKTDLRRKIFEFESSLPFKQTPYSRRNWGHKLHSLCSYQGKLRPAIAHWLIRLFVPEGGSILDPLGGVGTIPFEASLSGCKSVSVDKSPFASLIAAAKLSPPTILEAQNAVTWLEQAMKNVKLTDNDYKETNFGLNASVKDYYHPDTLRELLKAKKIFIEYGWGSNSHVFMWASLLHILHGNRPYALSRTSHPITPFHPSGQFEYRSLISKLSSKVKLSLSEPLPVTFSPGVGLQMDFRQFGQESDNQFDTIITSPPFPGMRFDRPNWLRLWFCGWTERNFHQDSLGFLERQQTISMDCYSEFFTHCRKLLKDNGLLILHIGISEKESFREDLINRANGLFELLGEVVEDVRLTERHGLSDKGRTKSHVFLFFS